MTTEIFMQAIASIFTLQNFIYMMIAIVIGIMVGALPGFTATMAIALFVPFTFTMSPISGLITIWSSLLCIDLWWKFLSHSN